MTREEFEEVLLEMHESARKMIDEMLAVSPLRQLLNDLRELKTPHRASKGETEGNK